MREKITVRGAREHNLKNVNIDIPRNSLVVISGKSGSGKSSLAFDTIFAEGQRRYMESVSSYARQFLGVMKKPNVEYIGGLSPAISIEQRTISNNPRSTVGTITEIYDYYRLLFSKIGKPYCPKDGSLIEEQSLDKMINSVLSYSEGSKVILFAPVVMGAKGTHKKELENILNQGFNRVRIDSQDYLIEDAVNLSLDKNKKHNIEVIVDRIKLSRDIRIRLSESIETALSISNGYLRVEIENDLEKIDKIFTEHNSCPLCGFSLPAIEPRLFSFNSPFGACSKCSGLGITLDFDFEKICPNVELSFNDDAFITFKTSSSWSLAIFKGLAKHYSFSLDTPIKDIPECILRKILYGANEKIDFVYQSKGMASEEIDGGFRYSKEFEGLIPLLKRRYLSTESESARLFYEGLMSRKICNSCKGKRLSLAALSIKLDGKDIQELSNLSVIDSYLFFKNIELDELDTKIAKEILKEIKSRLKFLIDVGLSYLYLDRMSGTLSGGEAQRIRLATQIGSALAGVLYILDEPSIGLHQRDNEKLISTLISLKELGNTVIVVEHDEQTLRTADYIVDVGPGAGIHGGEIVAQGTLADILNNENSLTGKYLSGQLKIEVPKTRRKKGKEEILLLNANKNNLKNINVCIPLGIFTVITGVSGSGKSTLLNEVLYPALDSRLKLNTSYFDGFENIIGYEQIDKIIQINQKPIGKTPRSNPATYVGFFTEIRELFAKLPESRARGFKAGRFSFNIKGGRCEKCQGDGHLNIQMHFLPDIFVPCDLCKGKKFNEETLEIRYKGKNIYDVLEMSVLEAKDFFESIPKVNHYLNILKEVGLGYIKLGQASTTLSGGEAQRIKLAFELGKKSTGKTFYIIDEPTTGLHFDDINRLLEVLQLLVQNGNTVVLIEHNLDVIKQADYIIDLGPEGGESGGNIIVSGTPEEVSKCKNSYTGMFLKSLL
ncbi:excinuclease ABC subunit UvrA [Borrelia miyamotoi]|uniref:UvrABC system protein A n=1 Tax=Borrelia miyamotoi TaxID=47466 RepID=A0AAX3JLL4_9SPIR|nr:excinuclease ABC subunit UvrA [Borrelia miyamotoi]QFP41548.1 excinuclease ABC subunit UvrA [Borrelia miyamotoi]QFP47670.1 excinuclease ABC subunit UvrA [Borrelia miyamotoi]QGT55430.1 excinuclease ABC subunit UvrA [Borrelia miyamotoi]QGT56212.1 excinuclease ABC subunit UvrA [Borrelia miyamotoi]WAZ71453.1 excinuclease ABC subunit UvrA [Borrelia miyamotoi]